MLKSSMQQAPSQDVFDMSVLINNSRDSEVTEMMTNVIEVLKDPEFVKYFTVDVGNALEVFEEELSDQAALNHKREVAGKDLTDVASAAKAVWSKLMSKISIDDMGTGYSAQEEEDWRTGFYSSLYRAAKL